MDSEVAVMNAKRGHYKNQHGLKNRGLFPTMRWSRPLHNEIAVTPYDDAVSNNSNEQLHQQYTQQAHAYVPNGNSRVVLPTTVFRAPQKAIRVHPMDSQYQPTYDEIMKNAFAQPQAYGLMAMNQIYQLQAHGVPRIWNGELSPRTYDNPLFSCKIFVGGIPWDITEQALREEFGRYGTCHVEWPNREPHPLLHSNKGPSQRAKATGYVYIVFEHEASVKKLMQECSKELGSAGECYFRIRRTRGGNVEERQVQVIPWVVSDAVYTQNSPSPIESKMTVFVGALHGMLTAKVLFSIMADVYGDVISVEIDTDKYKYPIGSGRVVFSSSASYFRAVDSGFLEIKTSKFSKRIQIDPYLEYSKCSLCGSARGPYFCREKSCFKYYCLQCWQVRHDSAGPYGVHRALMRKSHRLSRFEAVGEGRHGLFIVGCPTNARNSGSLIYRCGGAHQGNGRYASAELSMIATATHSTAWMTPHYASSAIAQNVYCHRKGDMMNRTNQANMQNCTHSGASVNRSLKDSAKEQYMATQSSFSGGSSENVDSVVSVSSGSPCCF